MEEYGKRPVPLFAKENAKVYDDPDSLSAMKLRNVREIESDKGYAVVLWVAPPHTFSVNKRYLELKNKGKNLTAQERSEFEGLDKHYQACRDKGYKEDKGVQVYLNYPDKASGQSAFNLFKEVSEKVGFKTEFTIKGRQSKNNDRHFAGATIVAWGNEATKQQLHNLVVEHMGKTPSEISKSFYDDVKAHSQELKAKSKNAPQQDVQEPDIEDMSPNIPF